MTQLSNANLLDDNVKVNLKNERIQKTALTAENPNMQQNNSNIDGSQNIQAPMIESIKKENTIAQEDEVPNNLPIRNYGKKSVDNNSDEKKILGMKPAIFYALLVGVVAFGGYLAYKKFKSGKGGKVLGKTTPVTPTIDTPKIEVIT